MDNRAKDPMIKFRSVIKGKNSKGGDRHQLYLDQENAALLIETIQANITNPKGVKIDLHVSRKTAQESGREFDSAICFVKAVSDMGAPGARPAGPTRFAPKAGPSQEDLAAKINAIRAASLKV